MTDLERLRAILELLDRVVDMFNDVPLDDWHRRRVDDAISTIRINAERELGIVERQLIRALHPTYEAHQ